MIEEYHSGEYQEMFLGRESSGTDSPFTAIGEILRERFYDSQESVGLLRQFRPRCFRDFGGSMSNRWREPAGYRRAAEDKRSLVRSQESR